jgi:tetratricopeptide (TPR) repeat protein
MKGNNLQVRHWAVLIAGLAFLFIAFFSGTRAFGQTSPLFQFTGKPGPYPVGLNVVEQHDYSRSYRRTTDALGHTYKGERARPLQVLVWYPAVHSNAVPMTVGDYINLWASETDFAHPRMPAKGKEWQASVHRYLKTPLWAVRDAATASGRFPVVIYAPGAFGESWDNADLCEYLASYGYVIVASPMMGATTRQVGIDLEGINAAARDISFLIGYAQTLPNTDTSNLAVAGMSWGGIANLFAAARDSRIDALVALDGSMRYYPGLVQQAGDVHPNEMTIPLLALVQRGFSPEDQDRYSLGASQVGPNVFNAWTHGDFIYVQMLGLIHGFLTSAYPRNDDVWWDLDHLEPLYQWDYGREDVSVGYGWVARYTLNFLDAYLKHDQAAMTFLKQTPAQNGVPPHTVEATFRAASGVPASFDGLRAEAGRRGFDHLAEIYADMKKANPAFKPGETLMADWDIELSDGNHLPEAMAVLRLESEMYPESGGVYERLGDAYRGSGQKQQAIDSYKKAIELSPLSGNPIRKLAAVEAQA